MDGGIYSEDDNYISALSDGSCLVTGLFIIDATFGTNEANETILTSSDIADIFVAKYNADGTLAHTIY